MNAADGPADPATSNGAGKAPAVKLDDSEVIAAVQEYLTALEAGRQPERAAFVARYPTIGPALDDVLDGLEFLHAAAPRMTPPPEPGPEAAEVALGTPLGDFRILREIGRGGMGVVYEAQQLSLGRRVALKVLPFASSLDAKQLQRFKNEAQAAAGLHHPNIVPVYATGCERGVHYYAMQFIDGHTLAHLIADLRSQVADAKCRPHSAGLNGAPRTETQEPNRPVPSILSPTPSVVALSTERSISCPAYFRTVARLGMQAAEALEHAHLLGVIHRDIKPANLLVDGIGHLWVTDFGLAHCQSQAGPTMTGDLIGTLRYMSPEQALAQRVVLDPRTDVYSLGVTLYELLILEPAIGGRDRQEVLQQIAFAEPRLPRRINPAVPAELETIVLKAMAKNHEERYASARDLADDLERFLKDQPILARRPTPVQRARKWARRHRPAMWSAAVALFGILAVLAGSVGWVMRDRAARRARMTADLHTALDEARRNQNDGNWPQAEAAAFRAGVLLQDAAADPELTEKVTALLGELAEQKAEGQLVADLEEIRLRQSEVDGRENHFVLERAFPEYRLAFQKFGLHPDLRTPEAAATVLGRRPEAVRSILLAALDHWLILARYRKAPEAGWLLELLSQADPDPWREGVRAARMRDDRAALELLARDVDPATQPPEALFVLEIGLRQRGAQDAAVALLRRAQEVYPGDFWINHDLGMSLTACQPPQFDEAIRFLTASVALRPASAGARLNLGRGLLARGRLDEAIPAFRQAVALKHDYAVAHAHLGIALLRLGQHESAVAPLRRATELKSDYVLAQFHLGVALSNQGRFAEAAAAYHQVLKLQPAHAEAHCNLGDVLQQQGEFAQALTAFKRGHELGSKRREWPYPSARWVAECQRMNELEGRLPAILGRLVEPRTPAERLEYAQLCFYKKLYATAARLRAEAFTTDSGLADDRSASARYDAACAAALAGCGIGADADQLKDADRGHWRQQALAWLRADLAVHGTRLESGKSRDRQLVRERLGHWQSDPDLAGVRDSAALARLPVDEQPAWLQLWADVRALVARARTMTRASQSERFSPVSDGDKLQSYCEVVHELALSAATPGCLAGSAPSGSEPVSGQPGGQERQKR
jgi:serine/threonine protein kinase/Flp pilus assembly protein TadD